MRGIQDISVHLLIATRFAVVAASSGESSIADA
jgi:hypothetical protein